jgi:hypothetical protein
MLYVISLPSEGTQSSACPEDDHAPQLDTASAGQVHQNYIFCKKHNSVNTINYEFN